VIVGGYGRSGKAAARVLKAAGVPLVAVELSHAVFNDIRRDGHAGVWGDVTAEEILGAAHIKTARILLLTIPDLNTIRLCVERTRRMNSGIVVIARAAREHHVAELGRLGVDAAVQSEFEGGVEMVRQALVQYRCDNETVSRLVAAVRNEFYEGRDNPAQPR
jgi:CPA2 family monovalent cation:H+ antiporter-2